MIMNDRLSLTNNEKLANTVSDINSDVLNFNMNNSKDISELIQKEKANKFNDQVSAYVDKFEEHRERLEDNAEKLAENIENIEIKPMYSRVIIKPFVHNPFQRIKIENGIITDLGGLTPEYQNTDTGEIEEAKQMILTGCVVEVGPDVKYLREGDTVFYQRASIVPLPFFKQGFICVDEHQIFATVNEGLQKRFDNIK
jgi:gas vesicle protein